MCEVLLAGMEDSEATSYANHTMHKQLQRSTRKLQFEGYQKEGFFFQEKMQMLHTNKLQLW